LAGLAGLVASFFPGGRRRRDVDRVRDSGTYIAGTGLSFVVGRGVVVGAFRRRPEPSFAVDTPSREIADRDVRLFK
jgi:hypothetical protein